MKATFKNICISLAVLLVVMVVLITVDNATSLTVVPSKTQLKVAVVDLDGAPVHNAKVTVRGKSFNTDNKVFSPCIELDELTNSYGDSFDWGTENVVVSCKDYVTAVVFNCVVFSGQTRKLTVKIYPVDSSDLPYVSYVESPPDDYIKALLAEQKQ